MATFELNNKLEAVSAGFISKMQEFQNKLNDHKCSESCDERNMQKLILEFTEFRENITQVISDITKSIQQLFERNDELEAYSRKTCLVLHGVDEEKDENVEEKVLEFINKKVCVPNYTCEIRHINNCHRLGPMKKVDSRYKRPIIVKFISYLDRKKIWGNKKSLKGTGYLITESLTKVRMELYKQVKELCGAKNCYTNNGVVVAVLPDGRKKYIKTNNDFQGCRQEFDKAKGAKKKLRGYETRSAVTKS